jgi:aspartyl-tRNA(Asn)/glutamyl-tRNA(Gln) amidotransferase subunit A
MAVVGLAEETGGSIQNPAAAQALVGIKPTFALVANVGVMPLASSTRDVVGPIARTVHDAALVLDVLAGYDAEDPKTVASVGKRPPGGYTSLLKQGALRGKRLGLYGPGWGNRPLLEETAEHYRRAQTEMVDRGAVMISDPFAGSGFEALAQVAPGTEYYDARGMECLPYDMEQYLRRMGPNAAIASWQVFAAVAGLDDPFAPGGVLPFMPSMAGFAEALSNPGTNSTVDSFFALRERYLAIFNAVMDQHSLDGLVFPQLRAELPLRHSNETLRETAVCEINIAGLPAVTVPGGYYRSGSPFGLLFIGRQWDEAALLGMAYDYEQATCHGRAFVHG